MKRKSLKIAAAAVCFLLAVLGGIRFYTETAEFIASAGRMAAETASEKLGTRVTIEGVRVSSLCSVSLERLTVYDKKNKKLAEAEGAEAHFSLFSVLFGNPVAAIREVALTRPGVYLEQRGDGKWNYEDLLSESSEDSGFRGKISVADGRLGLKMDRINETVEPVNGSVQFGDGRLELDISAACNGQPAKATGTIKTAGTAELDLLVTTDGFDISKVLKDSPFKGSAAARAKISGPADRLKIDGEASSQKASVYGYELTNARVKAVFCDKVLTVSEAEAEVLGGKLQSKMELDTGTLRFDGTAKLDRIDTSKLGELVPDLSGKVTADLGFAGQGADTDKFILYGSAEGRGLSYSGLQVSELHSSFCKDGRDLVIDYLCLHLPEGGELGLEGRVTDMSLLELEFYGMNVDLGLLQQVNSKLDMQGKADFSGAVRGSKDNPKVRADFSAIHGKLFRQPFRTLHGSVGGSLNGVLIKNFSMENGGPDVWKVKGTAGFTGEKRLNLQIDTVGARMEDIAALVAPDQPITGNIDNILTITGTMDNPDIKGYVHFYRGSYGGMLLQGMDGDYTMKNGLVTLQDFHIFSPLVDMELNGTVDPAFNLDLQVEAKDVSLDRFGNKLPYPINGHGRFVGKISGNVSLPVFDGQLYAPLLDFNGIKINAVQGTVHYQGKQVSFKNFGFSQNGGSITLNGETNVDTLAIKGQLQVVNADVNALLAMFNFKNDIVQGRLNGTVRAWGSLNSLKANLQGTIDRGDVRGYEFHDLKLDAGLDGRVITLDSFSGCQGTTGVFAAAGLIDLDGPLNLTFSAKGIQAGILPKVAGSDVDMSGLMDIDIKAHGTISNPEAEASVNIASGGLRGSGFDSMNGLFTLRNRVVNVDQFIVEKSVDKHSYRLAAYGAVPLGALTAEKDYNGGEQFNLKIDLNNADMSLLPMVAPGLEWAIGNLDGHLLLTGTMARPLVNGMISLQDGAVKAKLLQLPVTNMTAQLDFSGDTFTIEKFSGKLGKGSYSLTGRASIDGRELRDYGFQLDADKLEIMSDFYRGPVTASLQLAEGTFYRRLLPKLSGRIFIDDTTVSIPSIPESEGELPEFIVDLQLDLGKKVKFYSPYVADLKLGGAVHFSGTTKYQQASGHIGVIRGKINYMKTPFKVREGSLQFNNAGSFLPSVSFFADTKLDRTKIFLMVRGPIGAMKFKLKSSPDMRQSDILQLLTFRTSPKAGGHDPDYNDLLEAGLQMTVLSELEGQLRDLLQLDEFSITRDTENKKSKDKSIKEGYNIEMGKYISDKVMLKYIQGVGSRVRRYGVQYDFDDRMSMSVLRDEDKAYRFGMEARFRF